MSGSDPSSRILRSPWVGEIGGWLVYLLIAVFASWPLAWSMALAIPMGVEGEATVPLLNVWTLWWNSDRAAAGFRHYWDAPIFYPTQGTFAFSESQPSMILVAPIVWMTGNCVFSYNVYLLLILSLNGWSCRGLLKRVGHQPWLAFCGGVMCEMLPFVWWQLGVVQLTTVLGINWTIHSILDVFEPQADTSTCVWRELLTRFRKSITAVVHVLNPSTMGMQSADGSSSQQSGDSREQAVPWMDVVIRGLRLGGSFSLTYWLCNYWGLFLAMLVIPSSIALWNLRMVQWKFWCEVAVSGLVVLVLVGPIVVVQRSLSSEHRWTRERELIVDLSAHTRDYLDTPRTRGSRQTADDEPVAWTIIPQLEFPEDGRSDSWALGGGGFKLLLAPLGLLSALLMRGRRRWGMFVVSLGTVAYGISMGPTFWITQWNPPFPSLCPYEMLQKFVPGFSLIRSPFRFALFVQLAIVWLSVEAIDLFDPRRWWKRCQDPIADLDPLTDPSGVREPVVSQPVGCTRPSIHRAQLISKIWWHMFVFPAPIMVLLSLITVFEVWPPAQRLYSDATSRPLPVWIMWLKENSAPTDAIACFPFPNGRHVRDYEETAVWMYWGTFHHRPLVSGYSGFFPERFVKLKDELSLEPEGSVPQLKHYPWDNPGLKALNESDARFVVMKRSFASRDDVWDHTATKFRWAWVTGDELNQVDVYEIQAP